MIKLSDAMKTYRFARYDPRPVLLRGVSHNALRVSGALNGRNNLGIINLYRPVLDPAWMAPVYTGNPQADL